MPLQFNDEFRYRIISLLEEEPTLSQRQLAARLGISLGKVNFCLQALVDKGWLKASRFYGSENKRAYMYVLTPQGIRERVSLTLRFLQRKTAEYEALKKEIAEIRSVLGTLAEKRRCEIATPTEARRDLP
jgi:EPS-associated MarR family transcriptional regulator